MKKFCSIILSLVIVFSLCPLAQAAEKSQSGDLNAQPLTREAILEKLDAVSAPSVIFSQTPSVKSPYSAGKLADEFLENGLSTLNLYRYLAHLPQVGTEASLNDSAQHGAVLMAANDVLSHYPSKPSDMPDEFYEKGAGATRSSNIHYNYGYPAKLSLQMATQGFMKDVGSLQNLSCLGHRRWILNPRLGNVGFGYAPSASGSNYVDLKVFDTSGPEVQYDFISWPSSGQFPLACFDKGTPWSITLNPQKYQTPSKSRLTVTITSQKSGEVWRFNGSTAGPAAGSDNAKTYFTVDNNGYGVSNCLIFNLGSQNVGNYSGTYTVKVEGLQDKTGADTSLEYDVDFFESEIGGEEEETCRHEYTAEMKLPTCTEEGYTTYTCIKCGDTYQDDFVKALGHMWGEWMTEGDLEVRVCTECGEEETREPGFAFLDVAPEKFYYEPVKWAVKDGVVYGIDSTHFCPERSCTRGEVITFLWRAAGKPVPKTSNTDFLDVESGAFYYDAVSWAVENGITSGTDAAHFEPGSFVTRGQFVTFLYRFNNEPVVSGSNSFKDVGPSDYYYAAVLWAAKTGVTSGTSPQAFSPNDHCSRGQAVTFLHRDLH